MLLKDKVCLITGCSRGIGKQTVKRFAEEGAVVYAVARENGVLDSYCKSLFEKTGSAITPLYFDVTDEAAGKQAVMQIKKEQGRLDVLVNNAGIMRDALIGMIDRKLISDTFNVNVFAVMNMIQLAFKLMSRAHSGSIINLASIVGVQGNEGQLVYSASKGAVVAMTKTAAKELAKYNVRVNAVAPGMVDTDMFHSVGEERVEQFSRNIRMGRLATPEDISNAIVFLASDLSAYITGQILGVDGGEII